MTASKTTTTTTTMTFSSSSQTRFRNPHGRHFASLLCARFRSVPLSAVSKIHAMSSLANVAHTREALLTMATRKFKSRVCPSPKICCLPSSVTRSQAADITQMQLGRCAFSRIATVVFVSSDVVRDVLNSVAVMSTSSGRQTKAPSLKVSRHDTPSTMLGVTMRCWPRRLVR